MFAFKVVSECGSAAEPKPATHEPNGFPLPEHPNIKILLCIIKIKRQHSILVYPLMDGSLRDLMDGKRSSIANQYYHNPPLLWEHYAGIISGLAALHHHRDENAESPQKCWIHRDIKPENILIKFAMDGGGWCIADLDGVREVTIGNIDGKSALTRYEADRPYAAPEGFANGRPEKRVYCRSDVFAMGAMGLDIYVWYTRKKRGLDTFWCARDSELGKRSPFPHFYYDDGQEKHLLESVEVVLRQMENPNEEKIHYGIAQILRGILRINLDERWTSKKAERDLKRLLNIGTVRAWCFLFRLITMSSYYVCSFSKLTYL